MPKIKLIDYGEVWNVVGPFIIGAILIIFSGLIVAVILNKIGNRFYTKIVTKILILGIVVVLVIGIIAASDIWGNY